MLDADRLRCALDALGQQDPVRAAGVRLRAKRLVRQLQHSFPGDPATGILGPEDEAWEQFADLPEADAPCPVLDPADGRCELYAARPLTCRIFGPPVRNETGMGVCELCYVGAPEAAILTGEMHLEHHALEEELNRELPPGETIIAWALLPSTLPDR